MVNTLTLPCQMSDSGNVLTTCSRILTVAGMAAFRSDEQAPVRTDQDALLWPDPQTGPWLITVTWADFEGRLEPVSLEIRGYREDGQAWPPVLPLRDQGPAILATTTLREIPFATIVADLRRQRAAQHADFIDFLAAQPEYQTEADQASLRRLRSSGTRRPAALAEVAEVYRHAWRDGRPPTRAVAEHFVISQSAAAKRVARARQAGYLPLTTQGKPGARRQEGAGTGGEEPK